ncbi:MAG: hypothetical protein ACI8PZ_005820 [Myxococcota bacterium]|jgi:hypothetical protein
MDHPARWTEAMLDALAPTEHDFQEFKGSAWLDDQGCLADGVHVRLSKQVSAFANGAGGRLFIGIDDQGRVDGGVHTSLRNGTRSWLEDVIAGVVSPRLEQFNVFEVTAGARGSRIGPGRAVYVVAIPPSDHAPHMAIDHRYYMRTAGKSRPMGHVHLLDVLRRALHPTVDVVRVSPYGTAERVENDPRGPKSLVHFRVYVANQGRTLARHVGVELVVPRPLFSREVRQRVRESAEFTPLTQRPGSITLFRYHPAPIFPGQEVYLLHCWLAVHGGNVDLIRNGAELVWRIYADDSPPRFGSVEPRSWSVIRRAIAALDR